MSKSHLVILKKQYLDAIISGSKTIECRLLKGKCPPFGCVSVGDKLFLKESSGPVCAVAFAGEVKSFENLTADDIDKIKQAYNNAICGGEDFWQIKRDSKFCVLIELTKVKTIEPVYISKKDWRAWVVLSEKEHYGLLK
jgi:ASC-1-like (ASCH) protein